MCCPNWSTEKSNLDQFEVQPSMRNAATLDLPSGRNVLTVHILTGRNMNLAYFDFRPAAEK
jgi:hypothetical protein